MEIKNIKTNTLNQNNYNTNKLTPDQVGSLVVYPVDYTPQIRLVLLLFILSIIHTKTLYPVTDMSF